MRVTFVVPSYALDPIGIRVVLGCGCGVVSTDIDGVGEYVHDGLTALLSPARDPDALAANLCPLLDDDALRLRLAHAGHTEIQQFIRESSTQHDRALAVWAR